MRYSLALLALVAAATAVPVLRRQSNSTDVSSQDVSSQDVNNGLDLSNIDNNLDLNNNLNLNSLDFSNLDSSEFDFSNINVNEIIDQLEEQILLSSGNFNNINDLDLGSLNDLQLNNFDLNSFNSLFDSQFSVQSVLELLEGIDSSNVLDLSNNIDLESFADQFNEQEQSEWQANEILALLLSSSGEQDLQQLADLASIGSLDNNNFIQETQIQEISI